MVYSLERVSVDAVASNQCCFENRMVDSVLVYDTDVTIADLTLISIVWKPLSLC